MYKNIHKVDLMPQGIIYQSTFASSGETKGNIEKVKKKNDEQLNITLPGY